MFEVFQIDPGLKDRLEQMGSKPKFWYKDPSLGTSLFKAARPGTGEHWSEKVAEQLCALLRLPHAKYELAICGDVKGTISPTFTEDQSQLVHGNELLVSFLPRYEEQLALYSRPGHTLERIFQVIASAKLPINWQPVKGISATPEVFVGYLLLDAWICNGDRHDQNWGLVIVPEETETTPWSIHLAPTFDHASSLGRNESDESRLMRLKTADSAQSVRGYAERSRSAIFNSEQDKKPMKTLECFEKAAQLYPKAARIWLANLKDVLTGSIADILESVPTSFMSDPAKQFAAEMLRLRREQLLSLEKQIK